MQKTKHLSNKSLRRSTIGFAKLKLLHSSLFILLSSTILFSCHGKGCGNKESDSTWVAPQQSNAILSLDEINATDSRNVKGSVFTYTIHMAPSDSLPVVINLDGARYKDNIVNLSVTKDQQVILQQSFTKASFKNFVPENDMSNCALVGFSYNLNETADTTQLRFIATVGDPDETAGVNYSTEILVSPAGHITMQMAKDLETEPEYDNLNQDPSEDQGV
jgi:hypothetical protein